MDGLHESNIRQDGFLVRRDSVRDKGDSADRALNGVQQSKTSKNTSGHGLLVGLEGCP